MYLVSWYLWFDSCYNLLGVTANDLLDPATVLGLELLHDRHRKCRRRQQHVHRADEVVHVRLVAHQVAHPAREVLIANNSTAWLSTYMFKYEDKQGEGRLTTRARVSVSTSFASSGIVSLGW